MYFAKFESKGEVEATSFATAPILDFKLDTLMAAAVLYSFASARFK